MAGDALQTAAFERLASSPRTTPAANGRACAVLAKAAGRGGMCGGQYLDMVDEGRPVELNRLTQTHLWKTSALLEAACLLRLLDDASTAGELGKPIGSDADNGKTTFITLFGLDKCAQLVAEHTELAKRNVSGAFERPEFLCALADSLAERKN